MGEEIKLVLEKLDKIDGRMDNLENKMDRLEGKVDNLEVKVDKLEGKVDNLEVKVDKLEDKVDNLEEKVEHLDGEVQGLKEQVTEVQLTLENDTNEKISIIAEGHIDLSRNLHKALEISTEQEMLFLRVTSLETEVRRLKDRAEKTA